ncbi:hypothetical protein PEDI_35730 [Persicobacter diffluens]|uniref:HTH araC/xylS-type domain-containing protein n=2 Tax=Persicobacter diffluens TaxID=981 RepID=A0AAN4VZQ6_9BACT|nr:hypothetical protein PEDI_35730 [Persicobacter diffluens]
MPVKIAGEALLQLFGGRNHQGSWNKEGVGESRFVEYDQLEVYKLTVYSSFAVEHIRDFGPSFKSLGISFNLGGEQYYKSAQGEVYQQPNSCFIGNGNVVLGVEESKWFRQVGFRIGPRLLEEILGAHHPLLQKINNDEAFSYHFEYSPELGNSLEKMFRAWGSPLSKFETIGLAFEVLSKYFLELNQVMGHQEKNEAGNNSYHEEVADLARKILEENYLNPPSQEELSIHCSMSPSNLRKVFKARFGISIYQYIKQYRLKLAYQMLKETDWPVKLIGHRVGYTHMGQFSKLIKQTYGKLPSEIREDLARQ